MMDGLLRKGFIAVFAVVYKQPPFISAVYFLQIFIVFFDFTELIKI